MTRAFQPTRTSAQAPCGHGYTEARLGLGVMVDVVTSPCLSMLSATPLLSNATRMRACAASLPPRKRRDAPLPAYDVVAPCRPLCRAPPSAAATLPARRSPAAAVALGLSPTGARGDARTRRRARRILATRLRLAGWAERRRISSTWLQHGHPIMQQPQDHAS